MRLIDLAAEMGLQNHDSDPKAAVYVRVCSLVKLLRPELFSDSLNQSVLEEAFAVCVLETCTRAHADGVYAWRNTGWGES